MDISNLDFDYSDIKKLRIEKGISSREVADAVYISLSYFSLIENGKRNLSLDLYKKIITVINNFKNKDSIDLFKNTESKINSILQDYLENHKFVLDSDGIEAIKELILLYNKKDLYFLVKNNDRGVYNINGDDISNCENKIFTFDKERFEKSLLNGDNEEFLENLIIPTKEGFYVDCYSLDFSLSNFYNGLPIIINGFYKIRNSKEKCVGKLDIVLNLRYTLKLHLLDCSGKSLGYFAPYDLEFLKFNN